MKTIQGQVALVDDEDFEFLLSFENWFAQLDLKTIYARTKIKGRATPMHRLIVERVLRYFKGDVDHKDRNGLNNQRSNLRVATASQNAANSSLRETNISGFKGVSWSKATGKWRAQIGINGTHFHLGCFNDPIEAAKAYDCAAYSTWKEFAWLNFGETKL